MIEFSNALSRYTNEDFGDVRKSPEVVSSKCTADPVLPTYRIRGVMFSSSLKLK